mmetsp:Transcript_21833/g.31789  ORF Transcript_21833/g.31789 Transcript_21833/m.31789 type:complete len:479 (-) Transcript_21833:317-1753(-)
MNQWRKAICRVPMRSPVQSTSARYMSYDREPYSREIAEFMKSIEKENPCEPEFHQAVQEMATSIIPYIHQNPKYKGMGILRRMVEPERIIQFRVVWTDDKNTVHVNKGYRVAFNSAIGPYKGGLRFHPTVNLSVLKFLGFEQVFKNALTALPMGGGKGGSNFDPKNKSDAEVMRFCQAFMSELQRHIGPNTDIPAGDIGVGGREIGYLFGQYKRLKVEFTGALTGKGYGWGGSLIRPEATGYGAVYMTQEMLATLNKSIEGKTVVVSGSGNVSQHAVAKCIEFGAKVVTMSDSSGYVYDKDGFNMEKLAWVMDLKNNRRGRIQEYIDAFPSAEFHQRETPWKVPCDIALPCATQNELRSKDAEVMVKNGCFCVVEGANMPCSSNAMHVFQKNRILYAPGKASNAGGVATSGLEMAQNSQRMSWTREEVDFRLQQIMRDIHTTCYTYGKRDDGTVDYVHGANIAGFVKVADAMLDQGLV